MRRLICILLCLLIPSAGLAELKRGDTGVDVTAIQLMLWDTGFLFAEPDGIFGKQTEKAVKDFQKYAKLPQTGVVGDLEQDALHACWLRVMEEQGVLADDGLEAQTARFAMCCHHYMATDGTEVFDFCERHAALEEDTSLPAWDKWQQALAALYDEWYAAAPAENRDAILMARNAFDLFVTQQTGALTMLHAQDVDEYVTMLLRSQCILLCNLLYGMQMQ